MFSTNISSSSVLSPVSAYFAFPLCRPLVLRSPTFSAEILGFLVVVGFLAVAARFFDVGEGGDFGDLGGLFCFIVGFKGLGLRGT
jgi:hypothetical protein